MGKNEYGSIILSPRELDRIIEQTVKRTVEELGLKSTFLSRKEVTLKLGSRALYEKGVEREILNPIKDLDGSRNSKVQIKASELDNYLMLLSLK